MLLTSSRLYSYATTAVLDLTSSSSSSYSFHFPLSLSLSLSPVATPKVPQVCRRSTSFSLECVSRVSQAAGLLTGSQQASESESARRGGRRGNAPHGPTIGIQAIRSRNNRSDEQSLNKRARHPPACSFVSKMSPPHSEAGLGLSLLLSCCVVVDTERAIDHTETAAEISYSEPVIAFAMLPAMSDHAKARATNLLFRDNPAREGAK